ncbi:putative holin-like toxin [Lentibacillus juripiscarius]|uniref:Holin-like toxin n=1 Tax=Lentibacillus juripiscarius TaxID=257446 RepID=A0ABW5V4K2_9BACI
MRYAITEGGVALSIFETMVLMIAFATLVVTIIDHKK